jgi:hypothetical protein
LVTAGVRIAMTYNFDPDLWYDNHRTLLESRKAEGELSDQAFDRAVEELDREYEAMVKRLDGTYQLPK